MGFLDRLFGPPSEEQQLIDRLLEAVAFPLSPSHVGMLRGLKTAHELPAADDYGHRCDPQIIRSLAQTICTWKGLDEPGQMSGRSISFMGMLRETCGFEIEHLLHAMGESDQTDRSTIGEWSIGYLRLAPYLGGGPDDVFGTRLAREMVRNKLIIPQILSWNLIGLARLNKANKITPFESMKGWDVI